MAAGLLACSEEQQVLRLDASVSVDSGPVSMDQDGDLTPTSCVPNTASCVGDRRVVCNADGQGFEAFSCAGDCSSELGCTCVGGACRERVCRPGEGECSEGAARRCNGEGTGWSSVEFCPEGCVAGVCVAGSCTAGERLCSGDVLLTCNALGRGYELTNCGDRGLVCAEADGIRDCVPVVCTPNLVSCSEDGRSVVTCNAQGSAELRSPCPVEQTCELDRCAGPPCTPDCSGLNCGPDPVCGTSCGTCVGSCMSGQCELDPAAGLRIELTWTPSTNRDADLYLVKDGLGLGDLCASTSCSKYTCTLGDDRPDWDDDGVASPGDPAITDNGSSEVIQLASPGAASYYVAVHASGPDSLVATLHVYRHGALIGVQTRALVAGEVWNGILLNLSQPTPSPSPGQSSGHFAGCSGACSADADCPVDQACLPSVLGGGMAGACVDGCRSDADCAPQRCGGDQQCHASVAPWGAACSGTGDCQEGLYCGLLDRTCKEACDGVGSCGSDPSCCPVSNAPYCRQGTVTRECSQTP